MPFARRPGGGVRLPKHKTAEDYEAAATWVGGCLEHAGSVNHNVPRIVWMLRNGDLPTEMFVCHTCDNRKCIRMDHLFLGTIKDNTQDAARKGRLAKPPKHVCQWWKGKTRSASTRLLQGAASKRLWDSYTPEQRAARCKAMSEGIKKKRSAK